MLLTFLIFSRGVHPLKVALSRHWLFLALFPTCATWYKAVAAAARNWPTPFHRTRHRSPGDTLRTLQQRTRVCEACAATDPKWFDYLEVNKDL